MLCYTGATSKQWIAQQFALDSDLQSQIKAFFNYKGYAADVAQDIALQILTTDSDSVLTACKNNEFNFWLFRILKNQKTNTKSNTHKLYINFAPDLDIQDDIKDDILTDFELEIEQQHKEYMVQLIKEELTAIGRKNWYNLRVFNDYVQYLDRHNKKEELREQECITNQIPYNYRKYTYEMFGQEMNINKDSLFQVIKKVKQRLKEKIDGL